MANTKELNLLDNACKILFGPLFQFTDETLKYMQESGLKSAYRDVVKKCHPDKASLTGKNEKELSKKFKEVNEAYKLLLDKINSNIQKKEKSGNDRSNDFYYSGIIPKRILRFGEFLYYKKLISWNTLIKAITWQFSERPKIGQICKMNQIINDDKIIRIIKDIRPNEKFGEAAMRKGYLNNKQLSSMLIIQNNLDIPLGKYFIKNKIFTDKQIQFLLDEHFKYNQNFMNYN